MDGRILVIVPEEFDGAEQGSYWADYDGGGSSPDVWRVVAVADDDREPGTLRTRFEWVAGALFRSHNAYVLDPCGCPFCLWYSLTYPDGPPAATPWDELA